MSVSGFNKTAAGAAVNKNKVLNFSTHGTFSTTIDPGYYNFSNKAEIDYILGIPNTVDSWDPDDTRSLTYSSTFGSFDGLTVTSTISSLYVGPRVKVPASSEWTDVYSTSLNASPNFAAYGAGIFVVPLQSGGSYYVTSTDGLTWTSRTSIGGFNGNLVWAKNLFATIGSGSTVNTSTDGITWTTTSNTSANSITYGKGLFVTVGNSGVIRTSTDTVTWTTRTSGTTSNMNLITYGNGAFLAVGTSGGNGFGRFSTDGITWSNANFGTMGTIASINYGYGLFMLGEQSTGILRYSSTGNSNWNSLSNTVLGLTTTSTINNIFYENGIFGLCGANSVIKYKSIFENITFSWDSRSTADSVDVRRLLYGNGILLALGYKAAGTNPIIARYVAEKPVTPLALEYIADLTTL